MKTIFLSIFAIVLTISTAMAQSMDLASGITDSDDFDDSSAAKIETKKEDKQVTDDRGIFSFLNFSFIKKPFNLEETDDADKTDEDEESPSDATAPKAPEETPLQKMIRRAENGNVNDQLALGYMYLYGQNGVESDYASAFKYYQMAADQNNKIALNNLGSLYFNGIGTEVDYLKAAALFAQAAKAGSDDAALNLAFIYLSSTDEEEKLNEVVRLFDQAAKAGNNTAKFMLGYIYYKGFQVEPDYHKAIELIKESAAANFDEAQYVLALMYINGHGIAQNYGKAVKYLRQAQAQGHMAATMALADILAAGTRYPKNIGQAHIFYNIAAVTNTPSAAERRDELEKSLKIEELLAAQSAAEKYQPKPSELTTYIRQTFGNNVRRYIDENMEKK